MAQHSILDEWQSFSGPLGCLTVIVLIVAIGAIAYIPLDESGWIHHSQETPVWIQGDWMNGEYRDCEMLTGYKRANKPATSDIPNDYPRLFCGLHHEYELSDFTNVVRDQDEYQANAVIFSSQDSDGAWKALNAYFHVLPVNYFGRIKRPDKWAVAWHCQRNNESLTCKALN